MLKNSRSVIFKAETLIPVIQEAIKNKCFVLLVKDHGLYMMSEKGMTDKTGRHLILSYAEGFNPDLTGSNNWYYELRDICGGSDFCEKISVPNEIFHRVLHYKEDLEVAFTSRQYAIRAIDKP
ncbi:hypothetical protein DLP14_14640 [Salmonella enterica]|nr:hypothetical protein [Salmonella enterica]EMD7797639.1 DUF3085 domain-containing protein [Salmonella enterica]